VAKYIDKVKLFTDGGCKGNPGPGAIGLIIQDADGNELRRYKEVIGAATNNRAEYRALIKGLDLCAKYTRGKVVCYSDSQLLINQMDGTWRLKDDTLRELFHEVKNKERPFDEVVYQQVRRTNQTIKKVDRLVNDAFEGR
jgi:ribonuclease HI